MCLVQAATFAKLYKRRESKADMLKILIEQEETNLRKKYRGRRESYRDPTRLVEEVLFEDAIRQQKKLRDKRDEVEANLVADSTKSRMGEESQVLLLRRMKRDVKRCFQHLLRLERGNENDTIDSKLVQTGLVSMGIIAPIGSTKRAQNQGEDQRNTGKGRQAKEKEAKRISSVLEALMVKESRDRRINFETFCESGFVHSMGSHYRLSNAMAHANIRSAHDCGEVTNSLEGMSTKTQQTCVRCPGDDSLE